MSMENDRFNYAFSDHSKKDAGLNIEQIMRNLHPQSLLYLGSRLDVFVAKFRELGVQAYGMDNRSYLEDKLPEEIRCYCAFGSSFNELPDSFPKEYDIVIADGILERLYDREERNQAIELTAACGKQVLIQVQDPPSENKISLGLQDPVDWIKQFALHKLYRTPPLEMDFLSDSRFLLTRQENAADVIESYERRLYQTVQQIKELTDQNQSKAASQAPDSDILDRYYQIKRELSQLQKRYDKIKQEAQYLEGVQKQYKAIQSSFSWKLTKPLRLFLNALKKLARKSRQGIITMKKGLQYWRQYGFRLFIKKVRMHRSYTSAAKTYIFANLPNKNEQQVERETVFNHPIWFSILVPLYNTPEKFLREMIESVQQQTYPNWQLCLADGSDLQHSFVEKICRSYANADSRIAYKKLKQNRGISENTNACIEMATGEYIGLLDHDDVLHPSLLFEVMTTIQEQNADFIYTDEVTFEGNILNPITIHLKPDFAIDNLRANNYICHFSCFSRALLDQAGWFRDECNGSQDYDLVLRLTEKAKKVVHIRRVLYFWRSHPGSVAQQLSSKPYCVDAAKLAIRSHLERFGIHEARVDLAPKLESLYQIAYPIMGEPLISIITPNHNHQEDLFRCVDSILSKSTYTNYEIIVVENGGSDRDTRALYQSLERNPNVKVVEYSGTFNYPKVNELGVQHASGEYLLFLNNDTEVISCDWMEQMLMMAQREDVGAVGAKLYFEDDSIQHCGIAIGIGLARTAGHLYYTLPNGRNEIGYMGRLLYQQNISAVTAACMMISKEKYLEVGGFDPEFKVAYNDVDLCLKLRQKGYVNVFTPYAELYHYESLSRGSDKRPENKERFKREEALFKERWNEVLEAGDPYYPQDFDKDNGLFMLRV